MLKFYLLLKEEEFELFCTFTITGAGWLNDVNNFSFSSPRSGEDDFEIGSFPTFPFISASSFSSLPFFFFSFFLFFYHDFLPEKKYLTSRWFSSLRYPSSFAQMIAKFFVRRFPRPISNLRIYDRTWRCSSQRDIDAVHDAIAIPPFLIGKDQWFKDFFFPSLCIAQTFPPPQRDLNVFTRFVQITDNLRFIDARKKFLSHTRFVNTEILNKFSFPRQIIPE